MSASLTDKVALVTGANTGIGRVTAIELARMGAHVVLACRSREKAEPVVAEIKQAGGSASFLALDLNQLSKVRAAAEEFLASDRPLHILVNNAGLAGKRGLTADGFELTFGVNHLGPFLFTELLLERIKQSAPARIVNVASAAHYKAGTINFDTLRRETAHTTGLPEYQVSKLANVLHAKELAKRLKNDGVTTYSLHPGVVASDVWRQVPWPLRSIIKLFMVTNEEGALTSLNCATNPDLATESGLYYDSCKQKKPAAAYHDDALMMELHQRSLEWTGLAAQG